MTSPALGLIKDLHKQLSARHLQKTFHRAGFFDYMNHRREDEDMHAVSDAANDVRELDAELRCLDEMLDMLQRIERTLKEDAA